MDDRIRISDAERDRVTARLRDHFAEGRITSDELDERITAALNARTYGDLRLILADLPEPVPAPPASRRPARATRSLGRRHPRILPLILLVLLVTLVLPGVASLIFLFLWVGFVVFLAACAAAIVMAGRFRRSWTSGYPRYYDLEWMRGYRRHMHSYHHHMRSYWRC